MRITFIVVVWNSAEWIVRCLESIYSQSTGQDEVIAVDNASQDASIELIEKHFPRTKIIRNSENRGFTGGNNAALPHARAPYIALVNSDAVLGENWAETMLRPIEADSRIGIVASRILKADQKEVIDAIGDGITTAFTPFKPGHGLAFGEAWNRTGRLFGACAAGALYRKAMLDEIGFFDPDFHLLHEDSDLNFRANLAGWKCMYNPEAVTYHHVSGHLKTVPQVAIYHTQRNVEWLWIKNVPLSWALRHLPSRIAYEACAFAYYCLRLGQWRTYLRAKRDALAGAPKMWAKRKSIHASRKIGYREFSALMTPLLSWDIIRGRALRFIFPSSPR